MSRGLRLPALHGAPVRGLRRGAFPALLAAATLVALAFLALPLVALFVDAGPGRLLASLGRPEAREALRLSLETTSVAAALVVVVGTPAAYLLATRSFPGRSLAVTVVELPLVLPPAVAGIALLAALGPQGILGPALRGAGVGLVFQTAGVVVALAFVAAPFYLRQAQAAFGAVDRGWIEASRTLGAGEGRTFLRVVAPSAAGGLVAGLALAWGRALGEFGATLMFAGSLRGVTQTAPLAIYDLFPTDLDAAIALSVVLLIVSAALLVAVKLVTGSVLPGGAGR